MKRKEIESRPDEKQFRRVFQYEEFEGVEFVTGVGLVNDKNEEIVPCKYSNILGFFNGSPLAVVEINHKYGYIDTQGREVVPVQYNFADDRFYCGIAGVTKNGKHGGINSFGREVIPCVYEDFICFIDDLASTKKNNRYGIIDTVGNIIIGFEYDYLSVMGRNRICAQRNGNYGLIDYKGQQVAPFVYDGISDINSNGTIEYKKGNEHGRMDVNGNIIEIFPF